LLREGYTRREQRTTNSVRAVWYEKTFEDSDDAYAIEPREGAIALMVQVEFDLSICDDPEASYEDNREYSFSAVYLWVKQHVGEGAYTTVGRFHLPIEARSDLRAFCRLLGELRSVTHRTKGDSPPRRETGKLAEHPAMKELGRLVDAGEVDERRTLAFLEDEQKP
jgi:hypothetical protein